MNSFLNYITLGRNTQEINLIHFVRSLQNLSADQFTRTDFDLKAGASIDQLTGFSAVEPTS